MQSWRFLQLEPSALREPDEFSAPVRLGSDGAHLPATLYRLARPVHSNGRGASDQAADALEAEVYSTVASTLSELIGDVRSVNVDRDERRELLTLYLTGRDGTAHAARALSDGTLRFLALAVLSLDSETQGAFCLEEPENGIHPERIPAMIQLLEDLATNVHDVIGPDNPLRQVIINTHSPSVVMQVPEDSLLMAELVENERAGKRFKSLSFSCLAGTWRHKSGAMSAVSIGRLLAYLNPVSVEEPSQEEPFDRRRVIDRAEIRQFSLFGENPT